MSLPCLSAMPRSTESSRWNQSQPPAWEMTLAYLLLLYVSARTLQTPCNEPAR